MALNQEKNLDPVQGNIEETSKTCFMKPENENANDIFSECDHSSGLSPGRRPLTHDWRTGFFWFIV